MDDAFRARFEAFYEDLARTHPDVLSGEGGRLASTFLVPGGGGVDAQDYYMEAILGLVLGAPEVDAMMRMTRCVLTDAPPDEAAAATLRRSASLQERLTSAMEAAASLTAGIGRWSAGTDLFANVMANTDAVLQLAGFEGLACGGARTEPGPVTLLSQDDIDVMFRG